MVRFYNISITDKNPDIYDSEISRMNFLARLKPAKIEYQFSDNKVVTGVTHVAATINVGGYN